MVTTLYFHAATSAVGGTLPSTSQVTSFAIDTDFESEATNRSMNTTIGVAQASIGPKTTIQDTNLNGYYVTRFVSPTMLNMTSITAQTWTYDFAVAQGNVNTNFCGSGTGNAVHITCYVWRPSNGTIVGTILDGDSAAAYAEPDTAATEESNHGTFTGSAVSNVQNGDVIVMEVAFQVQVNSIGSDRTMTFYYDGTTEDRSVRTIVSNYASFIETPQTITFGDVAITGGQDKLGVLGLTPSGMGIPA